MKVQGKFKMQAHICRSVVMDVAAFKVSHSVDTDATALRAARVRSKSIGAMDVTCVGSIRRKTHVALPQYTTNSEHTIGAMERYMRALGSIRRKTHVALPRCTANSEHTIGAMDESSGRVQDASTPEQRCCHGYCSLQS